MADFFLIWLLPPGCNLLMLGIGFLLHHYWWKWTGRVLMVVGLISLYLFSTLAAGNRLLYKLQTAPPLEITQTLQDKKNIAIVILGAGRRVAAPEFNLEDNVSPFTLERVRYGATIARELNYPILLSGGRPDGEATPEAVLMNQVMVEYFDLPIDFLEASSNNTRENAAFTATLLKKNNIDSLILVTHAWHMKRALAHFQSTGMKIYPAPMGFVSKYPPTSNQFVPYYPTAEGLSRSTLALRERMALWWHKPESIEDELEESIVEEENILEENIPEESEVELEEPTVPEPSESLQQDSVDENHNSQQN